MKEEQLKQDFEYNFPYHYIPQYKENYIQVETWSWSKNYVSAIEFILKKIKEDVSSVTSIFDVGCGDGRLTKELSFELPEINVLGIDYSDKAIALAKAMNSDIEFYQLDIINNNFKMKCDLVTLIEVFEHVPLESCDSFIKAIAKLLNTNGQIHLTVPHVNVPVSYKHFQHFDLDLLKKYFEKYFDIEEVQYIQRNSFFLKIMTKLFSNNLYIINNNKLNNLYYKFYKKYCFNTNEDKCERIYLKLRKK